MHDKWRIPAWLLIFIVLMLLLAYCKRAEDNPMMKSLYIILRILAILAALVLLERSCMIAWHLVKQWQ